MVCCAESLDCFAGDFFREADFAAPAAVFGAVPALGRVALPEGLAALSLLAAGAFTPDPVVALAADAFAAAFLVAAFRAEGVFAAVFGACAVVFGACAVVFGACAVVFRARVFFADAPRPVVLFAVALDFLAALLPDALAVPLVAALAAAWARVRVDFVDAAMICLWFLTVLVAPENC